ncbi:MAG: hypothetical protein ABL888_18825 [Pirellulaceae bacterium]
MKDGLCWFAILPRRKRIAQQRVDLKPECCGRECNVVHLFDDLRNLSIANSNHVTQPDRSASQIRPDATVQNFILASLLNPPTTLVATGRRMLVTNHPVRVVNDVFMQVVDLRLRRGNGDIAVAVRTTTRCGDFDQPVVFLGVGRNRP